MGRRGEAGDGANVRSLSGTRAGRPDRDGGEDEPFLQTALQNCTTVLDERSANTPFSSRISASLEREQPVPRSRISRAGFADPQDFSLSGGVSMQSIKRVRRVALVLLGCVLAFGSVAFNQ